MEFKFFIGCTSTEDVKSKYRSLAKIHHPDKGGDSASFVALSNEYSHIINSGFISYPIGNARKSGYATFDGFEMSDIVNELWNRSRNYEAPKPDYDKFKQAQNKYKNAYQEAQDLAERQRRKRESEEDYKRHEQAEWEREKERIQKEPWYLKKKLDPKYGIIEQLVVDGSKSLKTTKWFLMEVYKLDDLTLDHFKFIREVIDKHSRGACNLVDSWVSESYRNYVAIQQMEWRY